MFDRGFSWPLISTCFKFSEMTRRLAENESRGRTAEERRPDKSNSTHKQTLLRIRSCIEEKYFPFFI